MGKNLPEVVRRTGSASGADHLWLRLQAFLSTRAPNTQVTYVGIIKEWCKFLGAEMGTADAAKKIVGAQDIHAIAFRAWLEKQPGNAPRMKN